MARLWRVHHADLPREPGALVELGGDEAHHLRRVLRLADGQALAVFDGAGQVWRATIVDGDERRLRIRLVTPIEESAEPSIRLVLFQGACRPEKMEWVVQKATEVGVAAIHSVTLARSGPQACTKRRLVRWRRLATEACKQCGRSRVPEIEGRADLPAVPGPATTAVVLDPAADAPPLGALDLPAGQAELWLAVGPEGGWTAEELAGAIEGGWLRAGLGPRVLRSDTAGLVAATILLHRFGDLGPAAR